MLTENEVAFIYDCFMCEETLNKIPKGLFEKSNTSSEGNEKAALMIIKYAVENYLHWSPETFWACVDYKVLDRLRLGAVVRSIVPPEMTKDVSIRYIAERIYPSLKKSLRDQALTTYNEVIANDKARFPKSFFDGDDGRIRAKFCLQKMINDMTNIHDVKGLYKAFSTKSIYNDLKKHKLSVVIQHNKVFATPLEYLHESLPESVKSDYWYNYYRVMSAYKSILRDQAKKSKK